MSIVSFLEHVIPRPVLVKGFLFLRSAPLRLLPGQLTAPALLNACRFVRYAPQDVADVVLGKTDPLIPPRRKIFIGGPEFRRIGDDFFGYFQELGGVRPHHRVLDIGCGIGRMSRSFASFLDPANGHFDGFDIAPSGIRWCQEHYAGYPHFRFQCADIYNKFYNPSGKAKAEEFTFPYSNDSFDFAFATSVFTHMPLVSVARYLNETARVLAPGGRALLTVFLWNPESQALVAQGKSRHAFKDYGDRIIVDPNLPEDAVALRESDWEQAVTQAGLVRVGDVLWGRWCGREKFKSYQDIVVVEKPDA